MSLLRVGCWKCFRQNKPVRRSARATVATERNPRNPSYWQALAEAYLEAHNYPQAAQAWTSAEQAAQFVKAESVRWPTEGKRNCD